MESSKQADSAGSGRKATAWGIQVDKLIAASRKVVLLLVNIAAWYTTNGMNGISMQSFAAQHAANATEFTRTSITVFVTALQVLLGAVVGLAMLHVYCNYVAPAPAELKKPYNFWNCDKMNMSTIMLAGLHALGSTCTNLGFMNGKASLVQVIKIAEPFETLLFTKLLVKEEGDMFTTGVVSSMCLTLGAALSLLPSKAQQNPSQIRAIVFAIFSGLSLSLRNVLQRRQHASCPNQQQEFDHIKDKLEKSLVLFTQVSFHSGLLLLLTSGLILVPSLLLGNHVTEQPLPILLQGLNVGLLLWHPLYNAFSMITLGFVSAVTHSLLNAGKRVYAILMAILWFNEAFTSKTAVGLLLVTAGGLWYTIEMKSTKNKQPLLKQHQARCPAEEKNTYQWIKPLLVVALLNIMSFTNFNLGLYLDGADLQQ